MRWNRKPIGSLICLFCFELKVDKIARFARIFSVLEEGVTEGILEFLPILVWWIQVGNKEEVLILVNIMCETWDHRVTEVQLDRSSLSLKVIAILRLTTEVVKILSDVSISRAASKIYEVIAQVCFFAQFSVDICC